jgi:hypothetical protein
MVDPETLSAMNRLVHEMIGANVLIAADTLDPTATGSRVRVVDGESQVQKGPFGPLEAPVFAFALIRAGSEEEALEWSARAAAAHSHNVIEVRQVTNLSEFGPLADESGPSGGPGKIQTRGPETRGPAAR